MRTKFFGTIAILAVLIFAAINSCKEDKEDDLLTEEIIEAAQDDAQTNSATDEVYDESDKVLRKLEANGYNPDNENMKDPAGGCNPTITVSHPNDTTIFPKIITIDFGTSGCTGLHGHTKKGVIIVTVTNRFKLAGSKRIIRFSDFYIDDKKIEGIKTVTNNGLNNNGNPSFTIKVDSAKVTKPNKTISWYSERTREWTQGHTTIFNIEDDEYSITGAGGGINARGKNYTVIIEQPLIVAPTCNWIKAGIIKIAVENGKTLTINYGDGTCDNDAVITVNGKSKDIKLNN